MGLQDLCQLIFKAGANLGLQTTLILLVYS